MIGWTTCVLLRRRDVTDATVAVLAVVLLNDSNLALPWSVKGEPCFSVKDKLGAGFDSGEVFG